MVAGAGRLLILSGYLSLEQATSDEHPAQTDFSGLAL